MNIIFALLAGMVTTLSPCVLPVLPFLLASSLKEHKFAPLSMCFGLILSFAIFGYFFAAFGSIIGIESYTWKILASAFLILFGSIFVSESASVFFNKLISPLVNSTQNILGHKSLNGLGGNFIIGTFLGIIWSPCSGPTLGTAVLLASRSGAGIKSFLTMITFGVGAAIPLLLIAYGAKNIFSKNRSNILNTSKKIKTIMGILMILAGISSIFGVDRNIESWIVSIMPDWLINLITKY